METHNLEAIVYELRGLRVKLNNMSECMNAINAEVQHASASEQKLYAFLGAVVDKILQHQKGGSEKH